MATTGVLYPSATAVSSTGTIAWSSTTSAYAADSVFMTAASNLLAVDTTDTQRFTSYGFSVPTGATIDGIIVTINRKSQYNVPGGNGGTVADSIVQLVKADSLVGSNKATASFWATTAASATYGSSTDLWGTTWTSSDINNSGFGAAFAASIDTTSTTSRTNTAYVDYIRIEVYYTVGSTGNMFSMFDI